MTTAKLSDMMSRLGRRLPKDAPADGTADGELLARFLATRDEHAFALIVRRHGPLVLGVCRRVTGNHHLAEDAFQAVFVVLAAKAGSVRPRAALPAWLYGVAHRTALRARTMSDRRRRRESPVETMPDPGLEPPDPVEAADTIAVLDEEIARLPEHLRAAVVLCELQGCSRHEAAKHLAIAEGTLSSRLAAARKALAKRLRQRGVALSSIGLTAALGQVASASVPAGLADKAVAVAMAPQIVPAPVAILSNGVLRMMLAQKLKAIPVAAAFIAAVVLAGGLLGSDVPAAQRVAAKPEFVVAAAPQPAPKVAPPKGSNQLLYWSNGSLRLIDPNGENERRLGDENERSVPARASLSPDGKHFAGIMAVVPPGEPIPADLRVSLYVRRLDEKWPGTDLGVECQMFCWSPDGTEIAFSNFEDAPNKESPDASHGIVNVKTRKVTALPIPPEHIITDWSRDGKHFLTTRVTSGKDGPRGQLFLMNRDGSVKKALTDAAKMSFLGKLSPDGKRVLFQEGRHVEREPKKVPRLGILEIATGKVERVADVPINGDVQGFCWSPDGKRIAYTWQERHEGDPKETATKETTSSLVICDPDGKNQKTIATETVPGPGLLSIMFVDWGFVIDNDKKEKADAEKIQGTWKAVSVVDGGNERDTKGARVVFTEGKVTITDDKRDVPGEYKLDPSKKPKWIDITVDSRTMPGIYELNGDKLRICLNEIAEGERPTAFESKGGSSPNDLLMVLEREKK